MIKIKEIMSFFRKTRGSKNKVKLVLPLQDSPQQQNKGNAGWISPIYSQSRKIHLNPGLLAANRCLAYLEDITEAEIYRVLRTQILQRTKGLGGNTIMITSALPGEGKTLTAINLAFSFTREFQHTVLLVDGDLKNQSIKKYLGCDSEKGLIDHLADGRDAHVRGRGADREGRPHGRAVRQASQLGHRARR